MYRRLLIFAIFGLFLVLGLNYLFVYPLNQAVKREAERQEKLYWGTFNLIQRYGVQPDAESELKVKFALDDARAKGLSKTRQLILQTYFQALQHCFQDDRAACKKANIDMDDAIRAPR